MTDNLINVSLTNEDAILFVEFRKLQDEFMILRKNGIFDVKNGSITIHFDSEGLVRKIETNEIKFRI